MSKKPSAVRRRRPSTLAPPRSAGDPERTWRPVPDPAPGVEEPIYVSFPGYPDAEALAEAASYVATLEANRQIARSPGPSPPGATHAIERDGEGHRRLVRRRFSAR